MNKYWPYIVIVILIFLLFRQCNKTAELDKNRESVHNFVNDTIFYYQNELGQEIAEKAALRGDKNTLEILLSKQIDSTQQLSKLVEKFRNVDAAGNITTITKIDTIRIPYEVPIDQEFSRNWSKNDKYYSIAGASTEKGTYVNSLAIPNTLSFAIGKKKTGFFKSEYRIEAVNSNPHVKTIGLDSYVLKVPKKRLGLSLYVGYGISDNFTFKPSAGLALTYTLFRF